MKLRDDLRTFITEELIADEEPLEFDDNLNTASVRLFSTPKNGVVRQAYVEVMSDGPEADAFRQEIAGWLKQTDTAWEHLARVAEKAYQMRQEVLLGLTAGATKAEAAE